jgi:hypothetical protein
MPSYLLSIVGGASETELSLPAPPVDLARRLARATGLPTGDLDAIAARARDQGDRITYDTKLVKELLAELKRLETDFGSRLDSEGFVRGAVGKDNHFNEMQRLNAAIQLLESAASQNKGARVQA